MRKRKKKTEENMGDCGGQCWRNWSEEVTHKSRTPRATKRLVRPGSKLSFGGELTRHLDLVWPPALREKEFWWS